MGALICPFPDPGAFAGQACVLLGPARERVSQGGDGEGNARHRSRTCGERPDQPPHCGGGARRVGPVPGLDPHHAEVTAPHGQ